MKCSRAGKYPLGIKCLELKASLLCPRGKVDMIEKQLVRIEQENRNRLLPKNIGYIQKNSRLKLIRRLNVLRTWSPSFVSSIGPRIDRTLVWVRIPDLNVVSYDESFLLALATTLGAPVRVAMNTVGGNEEGLLFMSTIWWIWRQRNILAFGETYRGDQWLLSKIYRMVEDMRQEWHGADVSYITSTMVSWSRLEEDADKLDVQATSLGFAGFEANLMPELLALKNGPCLAGDMDYMGKLAANVTVDLMIWETLPPGMGDLLSVDSMVHLYF
ncbi:hypothetical protein POTOM_013608 [Populus tomentosa]|uniref:DUF4283 domain-containing protein n=1 Tax=Populus tomentosa TaxID=118781 RepID=A0A8X8D9H9_POPTO|nr:hypothetical protein POTOM_013608 [Populus tomentosa]